MIPHQELSWQQFTDRYRYDSETDILGEGGFGSVFKVYDTYLHRYFALKVAKVRPGLENVRLAKEVEMVASLPVHPNVAHYEDCHTYKQHDGVYDYGILQYYEQGNLKQLIYGTYLTDGQKEDILFQLLDGIAFLHTNGIIHRDLKPPNVLILREAGRFVPLITDFGISKQLDINKSSIVTNSIAGAGTLAYASPEQLSKSSESRIKKNTDWWSFGVIAYQVFTGELPFNTGPHSATSEAGRVELFRQINCGQVAGDLNRLPKNWRTAVEYCLVTDPEMRVQNAEGLKRLLAAQPVMYRPAPPVTGEDTLTQQQPVPISPNPPVRPAPEPVVPQPLEVVIKERKKYTWLYATAGALLVLAILIAMLLAGNRKQTDTVEAVADGYALKGEKSVVINDVKWATCNVDAAGTFAASPEKAGKFYQWNRKKAWPATGPATGSVSNWDSSYTAGDTWSRANDPSPKGYRLPTSTEIDKLLDGSKVSSQWTKVNGVNGRKFTDKATGASIFLPAAGSRHYDFEDDSFDIFGGNGNYWSSTGRDSNDAYYLDFSSDDASLYYGDRGGGLSVRPVAE